MTDDPCNPESPNAAVDMISDAAVAGHGENLKELVKSVGPLPWPVIRWIAIQLADALEPLHAQDLAHGKLSLESIHLAQPWPAHQVVLDAVISSAATPQDDLRALGATLGWLLYGKTPPEDSPLDSDPEAKLILSAFSENQILSAGTLNELLINGLLDSLPSEYARLPVSPPTVAIAQPQEAGLKVKFSPIGRKVVLPRFAAAVAAMALFAAGAYFLFSRELSGIRSPRQQQSRGEKNKVKQVEPEQAAHEKPAAPLVTQERAAREITGSMQDARNAIVREREQAARDRAAIENAELAKRDQAAMVIAHEQAAKKKEIDINELVLRNEKILKNSGEAAASKERALSEILSLAGQGHEKAIELCGASYWLGNGVAKDRVEARQWFENGVQRGNARCMLGLGNCYEQGIAGPKDIKKAAEWWNKAASGGDPVAMSRLGEYFNSDPQTKDVRQAMYWWQKAADRGVPEAMTNLGILYDRGSTGVQKRKEAIELWEKASAKGEPRAKTELGYKYFNGDVPGKSEGDAFPLFLQAVEAGDPQAMTGLGVCYLTGRGTKTDKTEASKWLQRANERGEPTAAQFLKQLESFNR